jgi:hypothetical protein
MEMQQKYGYMRSTVLESKTKSWHIGDATPNSGWAADSQLV